MQKLTGLYRILKVWYCPLLMLTAKQLTVACVKPSEGDKCIIKRKKNLRMNIKDKQCVFY